MSPDSLWHTYHLDILHHTLPLPRYTCALTHLHIIQIYLHLKAPTPIHPYSYKYSTPKHPHLLFHKDTFILSSTNIVQIPSLSLSPSRYPYVSYMPTCVKYTDPHTYSHTATPNLSLVLSSTQIDWCSHSTPQTHHLHTPSFTLILPKYRFPLLLKSRAFLWNLS